MYRNKKIIMCKFNLKNKCKFDEKCQFSHLNVDEQNRGDKELKNNNN